MIFFQVLLLLAALIILSTLVGVYSALNVNSIHTTSVTPSARAVTDFRVAVPNLPMVTISLLKGGLGNQLLKIATAYAYAKRTHREFVLDVTEATFPYALDNKKYFETFYSWTKNIDTTKYSWETYTEREGYYDEIPEFSGHVRLEGYFQSAQYFAAYKDEILDLFFSSNVSLALARAYVPFNTEQENIMIHFRYIDYVGNPQFDILSKDYYSKAVNYMKQKFQNPRFIVFSDHMTRCKTDLASENCTFIEQGSELDQLQWMALCRHHIIPNSTFSWWAAYTNKTGLVVMPQLWCAPKFGNVWEGLRITGWKTDSEI